MLTDCPPLKARHLAGFLESDRLRTLDLPQDERLRTSAISVDSAMKAGITAAVRHACAELLAAASDFYKSRGRASASLPPDRSCPRCSDLRRPHLDDP